MKKTIIALFSGLHMMHFAVAQTGTEPGNTPTNIGQTSEVAIGGAAVSADNVAAAVAEVPEPLFEDPNENLPAVDAPALDLDEPVNAEGDLAAPLEDEDGGFLITDANINDIFQLLARKAEKQYFHNNQLNTDQYKVTGHLNGDTSPLKQMEELAFQYGLSMYVKGNTVYAMLPNQLEKLPAKEWTYSLNYLRPSDIEQIRALITPLLSPGRGIVNYEPKTNTIIVIDTMRHIEMVQTFLRKVDQPKGQVVIEVKILNVNSTVGQSSGINWEGTLGRESVTGVSATNVAVSRDLSSIFGLGGTAAASNLILNTAQVSGVITALNDANMLTEKSNPVIIAEDNETASISLIDRIPIITSTSTGTGDDAIITDEVRYRIDEGDSTDPETTREIGVTISMTPSILPDGTIRLRMRPRSAVVVGNIVSNGNSYPQVSEATIETIARIPDGHSLIIGGFFSETKSQTASKVPILGDIPIVNFFFKSKEHLKEQASLVFMVTPNTYDAASTRSTRRTSSHINDHLKIKRGHDSVDDSNPGRGHEADLDRTIRGIKSNLYPRR